MDDVGNGEKIRPPKKTVGRWNEGDFRGGFTSLHFLPEVIGKFRGKMGVGCILQDFLCFQIRFRYILYGDRCHHQFEMRCDTFMSASQRQG